jgi:hypothetical protein
VDSLLHRDGYVILVRHHLAERALTVLDGLEELEALRDMGKEDEAVAARMSGTDGAVGRRMANQRRTPASSLERGLMITGMIRRTPSSASASSGSTQAR